MQTRTPEEKHGGKLNIQGRNVAKSYCQTGWRKTLHHTPHPPGGALGSPGDC
jgi:hypothetical protein